MKNGILTAALAGAAAVSSLACDELLPVRREVVAAPPADSTQPMPAAGKRRRPAPAAAPEAATVVEEDDAFNLIRRSLRRLVAAEQGFYAENGAYTEDFDRLGFAPERGAQVRMLWVTREGWAASGTHPAIPGRDCVIFVGRVNAAPTSLKYVRTAREGVAACDVSPPPPQRTEAPAPVVSRAADTASALEAVNPFVQMRVDLRNLARSQDAYHATQGTYAKRLEPLALQYLFQRGVSVAILSADAYSWSARASHVAAPGRSCVVWFGPVRARPVTDSLQRSSERSGIPACDL
ncbi:MAG TPA: hypothetical protein VFT84_15945 [Gemmatimonadales bacterium]|nr:hypothetical protein [Gemmatimonadales bacterium]